MILRRGALGAFFVACFIASAFAQAPPSGSPVLNQAKSARVLTPNDSTTFVPTRGLHIGDAAACNISVLFASDTAPVTLPNVQPGLSYPYAITMLRATGTTCTSVLALR